MQYPNLIAEYKATGYHVSTLASHANVTVEIMKAILYGSEKIMADEAAALCRLFACRFNYLFAGKLSILDPSKNKTKHRALILREKIDAAAGYSGNDSLLVHELARARDILSAMDQGQPVSYAAYRHSLLDMNRIVALIWEKSARRGLGKTRTFA